VASDGTAVLSDLVEVTLSNVQFEDFITGELSTVTTNWINNNCFTSMMYNLDLSSTPCIFSSSNSLSYFKNRNISVMCMGFIKSVNYVIQHSSTGSGDIDSISAEILLTDLPFLSEELNKQSVIQSFGVQFVSTSSVTSSTYGNLDSRFFKF
jgi:hypothetical protein